MVHITNNKVVQISESVKLDWKHFRCLMLVLLATKPLIKTCWPQMDAHSCKNSAQDGCNRNPLQLLSESRVQPAKTCYGRNQNTLGTSGLSGFYSSVLVTCCRCCFPHHQQALTQSDFRAQRKLETAGSIMLLLSFNPKLPLPPNSQCLSQRKTSQSFHRAQPKGKSCPKRRSWSTELWGGLGHVSLPTQPAPKEIPVCKAGGQTPPHVKQLHTEVLGTTEGHSTAPQHSGNVPWNPAGHKHQMESLSGTAQQQLNLDTWDFLRDTKACSSSTISKKDKRQT